MNRRFELYLKATGKTVQNWKPTEYIEWVNKHMLEYKKLNKIPAEEYVLNDTSFDAYLESIAR
jgi:argininosuccinate synthase